MEDCNKLIELQDSLSVALLDICRKRSDFPEQCAKIAYQNLQLQQHNTEKEIYLPSKNFKKVACKYPLDQPIEKVFPLGESGASLSKVQDAYNLNMQVREDQQELIRALEMNKKPVKSQSSS